MGVREDLLTIGGVSDPDKMPCYGYSIPPKYCKLGSLLRQLPGTVCEECYGCKGMYVLPNVKEAMSRRFAILSDALADPDGFGEVFVIDFSNLLNYRYDDTCKRLETGRPVGSDGRYFRWHDAGDLQSAGHLDLIERIATRSPKVKHWLPTKQVDYVIEFLQAGGVIPANLVIRISLPRVDQKPTGKLITLSKVTGITLAGAHTPGSRDLPRGAECIAYKQDGYCMNCRACWSRRKPFVSYPLH